MTRILIVDDDSDGRAMLAEILHRAGYEVEESANGVEALRAQETKPFDVLITDIFMPEADGVETINAFHQNHPRTGIIAMSGARMTRVDYLATSLWIGARRILRKPFDVAALQAALKDVLAERQQ